MMSKRRAFNCGHSMAGCCASGALWLFLVLLLQQLLLHRLQKLIERISTTL